MYLRTPFSSQDNKALINRINHRKKVQAEQPPDKSGLTDCQQAAINRPPISSTSRLASSEDGLDSPNYPK
ncbi:hypothetical protein AB4K20DRAFT_1948447 [Rhizopus microsporus]